MSALPKIALVRSSINVDEVFTVTAIVKPGETISSSRYEAGAGGKGANVSAAIGRALSGSDTSASVKLVGAVGRDASWPVDKLSQDFNVDVSAVSILKDQPTGRAFIQVAEGDGEYSIVLLKGANYAHLDADQDIAKVTHLVLQNDLPLGTTKAYLQAASNADVVTIFNPSPMLSGEEVRSFDWELVDVLVVNESEAEALRHMLKADGPEDEDGGSLDVRSMQVSWLITTSGPRGVRLASGGDEGAGKDEATTIIQPAFRPNQVLDTTGAGDVC